MKEQLFSQFKNSLKQCPFVEEVWSALDLQSPNPRSVYQSLYQRSYHRDRSADITVQPKEYFLPLYGKGTTHGTPYAYDALVPVYFVHPTIRKRLIAESTEITMVAPLIAELLGIDTPERLDRDEQQQKRLYLELTGEELKP
jgi:hypothetical protein